MSAASRLAAAEVCFVKPDERREVPPAGSNIGLNSAGVPGGISAVPVDVTLQAGGLEWHPADAQPWACSIGYQLAVEVGARTAELDTGGAS